MLRYSLVFVVVVVGLRGQAQATCWNEPEITCFVNGEPGTKTCQGNTYGPCIPDAPQCGGPYPVPADSFSVQCMAGDGSRCAASIDINVCHELNDEAYGAGVLDSNAYNWLLQNGKCAIAY